MGTPGFMAPEQKQSANKADARSDVFSLGRTLYCVVTGELPEMLDMELVPDALRSVLRTAMARHPEKRFQSMREFAAALQAVSAGLAPALASNSIGLAPMESRLIATNAGSAATEDVAMRQGTIGTRPMGIELPESEPEPDLAKIFAEMQAKSEKIRAAAEASMAEHNYAQAVSLLEQIPEGLRAEVAGLLSEATTKRDRVQALNQSVKDATPKMQLEVLRPAVEELLQLQPQHEGMQRLKAQIAKLTPQVVARKAGEVFKNGLGMSLAYIPSGEFLMGAPKGEADASGDEQPQHRVKLTKGFGLGVYQVTQAQFEAVLKRNPSHFTSVAGQNTANFPVEQARWFDAVEFCNALSQREGLQPCYELHDLTRGDGGCITAASVERIAGTGYRLPTEAEWEYACRAGTTSPFHFGKELNGKQANVDGNNPYGTTTKGPYLQRPTAVGSYAANAWGLYDMHGNVWEWCWDRFDAGYYEQSPDKDPQGPSKGAYRVLRGGGWRSSSRGARAAFRFRYPPDYRYCACGFRVLCERVG